MNKRTKTPLPNESIFRDSDFAGSEPGVQARLSASLNILSSRVASAKLALAGLREPPSQTPEEGGQIDPRG